MTLKEIREKWMIEVCLLLGVVGVLLIVAMYLISSSYTHEELVEDCSSKGGTFLKLGTANTYMCFKNSSFVYLGEEDE